MSIDTIASYSKSSDEYLALQGGSTTTGIPATTARPAPPSSSSNNNAWDHRGSYGNIAGFDIDGTNSGGTKWRHGIYTGLWHEANHVTITNNTATTSHYGRAPVTTSASTSTKQ
jgi:hypothetical protein